MTRKEFDEKVMMIVEVESEFGGKCKVEMLGCKVNAFCDSLEQRTDEWLSDVDYAVDQPDAEVDCILDKAMQIWYRGEKDVIDRFGNLEGVIDSFLEEEEAEMKPEKRVWTEDEIRELIQKNDKVLYGALRKLFAQQTADEQREGETTHNNGVGFNGVDAPFMTSICKFLEEHGWLSDKQKAAARKKLVKYNKQLTRLANA